MESNVESTCCFIGHRNTEKTEELENRIYSLCYELIANRGVKRFLFGSKSNFDTICLSVLDRLKQEFVSITRIYVRAEYQLIDEDYRKYLLEFYDDTYFPQKLEKAGVASYVERNRIIIEESDYCVFYYEKNYIPETKHSKDALYQRKPKSGTALAYGYAKKKNKKIINLAK